MTTQVVTMRVRIGPESLIMVPQIRKTFPLGDKDRILEALRSFLRVFEDSASGASPIWDDVLATSRQVGAALFPDESVLQQLAELILNQDTVVKVIADTEETLQIPWELMQCRNTTESSGRNELWGYRQVFQRAYSRAMRRRKHQGLQKRLLPTAGVVVFDSDATGTEVYEKLQVLEEHGHLQFDGSLPLRSYHRAEDVAEFVAFLEGLDIAHLSCLIVKFRHTNEPFLVFSDAFLVSLPDLKEGLRFENSPFVFFDVCDNTWHLARERFRFLNSLIEYGSRAVLTSFCPVPRSLSASFSECLYEEMVANGPVSVHEALIRTRRVLSSEPRDPSPLLFWLYADPELDALDGSGLRRAPMAPSVEAGQLTPRAIRRMLTENPVEGGNALSDAIRDVPALASEIAALDLRLFDLNRLAERERKLGKLGETEKAERNDAVYFLLDVCRKLEGLA